DSTCMVESAREKTLAALNTPLSSYRTYMMSLLDAAGAAGFSVAAARVRVLQAAIAQNRKCRGRCLPAAAIRSPGTNPPSHASPELRRPWQPAGSSAAAEQAYPLPCRQVRPRIRAGSESVHRNSTWFARLLVSQDLGRHIPRG